MSYLTLTDRGRLVETCSALETSLGHPSLWNTVTIELYDSDYAEPVNHVSVVERFGAYIKDLTLVYVGDFVENSVSPDSIELIQCIARCCRYEILTLDTSSQLDVDKFSFPTDVDMQLKICTNQYLKSFTLRGQTWIDIRVVLSNDKLNGCLERLSLYWQDEAFGLPSPRETLAVTSQLTQMRALYLQASMLSDDILVNLSDQGRAPLRELGILVATDEYERWVPHTEASSWTILHTHSPCLQVQVKVVSITLPPEILLEFLIPEMQISFINLAEYDDICPIADMFSSTLRKFVGCTSSFRPGGQLCYMVRNCSNLVHFEYTAPLRKDTIHEFVGMRDWRGRHFQVVNWQLM